MICSSVNRFFIEFSLPLGKKRTHLPNGYKKRLRSRRLQNLVSIVISLCNDVMSFPREIGVIWNLPNILIAQGMSQQEAISETVADPQRCRARVTGPGGAHHAMGGCRAAAFPP
ncbi:terpene synthase family protein [Burkholderia cenocepacia]|nr:hypothetical protein [Burkholderia cenocepacia]